MSVSTGVQAVSGTQETDDDTAYWVAFRGIKGIGPVRTQRLLETFGTLHAAWEADPARLRGLLEPRIVSQIVAERRDSAPEEVLGVLKREGIDVVTLMDDRYPSLLREIPSPPSLLFVKGTLEPSDRQAVAIVGTRRMSPYGREMARSIASDLAAAGVTIVSGLAKGVDGVAHQAALEAGGRTIAVMGSGVRRIYPAQHRGLSERIVEHGALVSDFLPDAPPDAPNFPARNRLISGMSLGVIVIEAPERSGALITVDFAADQGRDVFALPGSVQSQASAGCNRILRDGARLIRNAQDVLDDLQLGDTPRQIPLEPVTMLDEPSQRIMALMTSEPRHIDDLASESGEDIAALSAMLMSLELQGMVRNAGGQFYSRSR